MPKLQHLCVRPITPADPPQLAAVHATAFPKAWDATALAGLLTTSRGLLACAPDGTPLGFLLWQQTDDDADLLTLAVDPTARRCGIARQLMQAMLREIALGSGRRVFLEVGKDNTAARCLYDALGFKAVGLRRNYYNHKPPEARDAWTLMLQIAEPVRG